MEDIGFEGLIAALFNDGFHLVYTDETHAVLQALEPPIEIKVHYNSQDKVIKIECNGINKENFIPLTLGQLSNFILGIRIQRPHSVIVN